MTTYLGKSCSFRLPRVPFVNCRKQDCRQFMYLVFHCLSLYFVGNVKKPPIASHLKSLDPSLDFCCQGSALTGTKEGG